MVFARLYVDPVKSGLVADMGPELWATLTVIAAHMDGDGRCFPTQAAIGRMLGVNRQTANKYVQRLLAYRWRGEPVVTVTKRPRVAGEFTRNEYTVMEASGFRMF
jgi:hypothetical protein